MSRELFGLSYEAHPYRRPVIGYEESVRSFRRDDVLAFYRRHYTPDNITLVVVGDVDPADALRRIEARWGPASGRHPGLPPRTPEPEQSAARARVVREPVKEAHLALAWHVPDVRHDDLAALDLCAMILGQGDASRLVLEVKRERRLVKDVYAYAYTPRDPGLLVAGATLRPEQLEDATRELLRQVYRLRHEGVSAQELAVAKHMLESEAIWQRETVQGMARKLGFFETVAGSLSFEAEYYRRVRETTVEELRAAAGRYLRGERLSMVSLAPPEATVTEERLLSIAAELDADARARPRTSLAAAPSVAEAAAPKRSGRRHEPGPGGIFRETLRSGVTVLVKPEPAVPLVAARAVWPGGLRFEDDGVAGVHHLMARLLNKGTKRRSSREVAARSDELAASIVGNAGKNSFGLRGDFLAKSFDPSFRLFAECLLEPAFREAEVERERQAQLHEIRAREDNPSGCAFDLFAKTLYTEHPYRLDPLGTEASVSALGPAELSAWLARNGPEGLVVSVVGDVAPEHAFALADELFGDLPRGSGATPPAVAVEPPPSSPRRAERRMQKQQAHLVLGFQGARVGDAERYPLEVLASVLAGQGGRLFTELRDKRSMAYSVTAFNLEGLDPGYFAVYMGCSPEKVEAAIEGIHAELRKVVDGEIPEEELSRARRYLVGSHAIGLQKNASRAAVLALDEAYGLGADAYQKYAPRIEAVTAAEVHAVAKRYLDPDRSVLAIVTPAPTGTA